MNVPTITGSAAATAADPGKSAAGVAEPVDALIVGGVLGATCFFLSALFFGPFCGILVAALSALYAFARRARVAALIFVGTAIVMATAIRPAATSSSTVTSVASLAFGIGLALLARSAARAADSAGDTTT